MHYKRYRKIETAIHNQGTQAVKGECYFCQAEVNGELYCFGCKEFICEGCDSTNLVAGRHDVSAHAP